MSNTNIYTTSMKSLVFVVLALIVLVSCKSKKNASKEEKVVVVAEAPEWVNARPHNSAYYIGIGSSSKVAQPLDYQNTAKKNALNDLASEISVRVQGQTFLNSLEVNKSYTEEFMSTISTFTDEKIEDFEVAGIWENDKEYYTYYRLSKAQYQRQKTEKKNKALSAANDFYLKGKTAENEANIPVAFDMYMRGLFAMKEYWNEVNQYLSENGTIHLDNEIFSSMQRIGTGLRIKSDLPKISLSAANGYQVNAAVTVEYNGKPAKGVSVSYSYVKAEFSKPRTAVTGNDGSTAINVSGVSTTEKNNQLSLAISLEPLIAADLDKSIQTGLIKGIATDKKQIPIELISPAFFIQGNELAFGQPTSGKTLASATSNELVKNGMRIATTAKDSNFIIQIKSNTSDGGTAQGFNVAHLEMQISVTSVLTQEVVYEESFSGIKGLQLNTTAAGTEAYKKGKEKIEKDVVKSILNNIL